MTLCIEKSYINMAFRLTLLFPQLRAWIMQQCWVSASTHPVRAIFSNHFQAGKANTSLSICTRYISDCGQVTVYGFPQSHHTSCTRNCAAIRKNEIVLYRHQQLFYKAASGQKCPSSLLCHPLKIYSCFPYTKTQTTLETRRPALPLESASDIAFL